MREGMGFQKELERFSADYEEEIIEMIVLTEEHAGGASSWVKDIWQPSVEFLASVDPASGKLNKQKGLLCWLAKDEDRGTWIFDLKGLTTYHVKCRRIKEEKKQKDWPARWANSYMLVDVVEREPHNEQLEKVLEKYKKPVVITDELCGKFELERAYNWFSTELDWLGETCSVSLECDKEDGVTANGALAAFQEIYANLKEWDEKFRAFAAEELTELANEWQDEADYDDDDFGDGEEELEGDDSQEDASGSITEEDFARRISISEFSIDAEGDYTAYYEDDDMFFGHVILVVGNVKGGIKRADIAG